jgi:hypothetical protein
MKHLPSTSVRRRHRRGRLARLVRGTLYVKAGLVAIAALVIGTVYLRLSAGPLSFSGLPDRVAAALAERIGPGWKVTISGSAIELQRGSLALRTVGLDIRDPSGALVVRAPNALVSVDTLSLVSATLQPRSIEFHDLQLRATIARDGSLSFAPAGEVAEPVAAAPAPHAPVDPTPGPTDAPLPEPLQPSTMSAAVASLFDLILEPSGIVGVLDRASIANARLTLVDADGRERAVFGRVEAAFERSDKGRRFDMRLEGPRGPWRLAGEVGGTQKGREGVITASDVPVGDLLLLSGLSKVPASTDLKLSGRAQAALTRRWLTRFDAHLTTTSGTVQIHDEDMPPIQVDAASAETSWDETRRTLVLKDLAFRGGRTAIGLAGELTMGGDEGWRLAVSGNDSVLSGATPGDPPFQVSAIEARLAGAKGGIGIERLAVRGPALDAEVSGSVLGADDDGGLRLTARAGGTGVREALRLWPEAVSPKVRRYLVENLRSGVLDRLGLTVALGAGELADATAGRPIPDQAVKIDFAIKQAELGVAAGLPALSRMDVSGSVTGTDANVRSPTARVEMPDGRALAFSAGAFSVSDIWAADALGRISFKLDGGADAVGSFLQSPAMRSFAGIDLDPASLKGRAELRVAIPLALNNIPPVAELPVSVAGTISDFSMEKAFGKEKLEGAAVSLAFDKGRLVITGTGKLAGTPASIDVRQPRNGPGEVLVAMTLDDAARARKGMSFGTQLTGPVPIRVVVPLGPKKAPPRIEADLTRAVVDDFIPGWTKPAGRPGRLSFALVEGKGTELRDLHLESGPVQVRGTVALSPEGNLEKADLATFKLSPGDDLRVQLDRSGSTYKVVARGNVADARPFLKGLFPGSSSGPAKPRKRQQHDDADRDIDLDIAANILTGFNDEAMTNASIKATVRKSELRSVQLAGRFGAAAVSAQTVPQRGAPVLTVQTQDAGALLRFLDVYRRMVRGTLALQVALGDGVQVGSLAVDNFALRAEPALRRIISQNQAPGADDTGRAAQLPRIDVNDVDFARARVDFTRTAGHLAFRDASIVGAQVGFTLSGWVDFSRDRADISGTFVPAYGLNNAFAQVPLFGPLLGGGRNEGLFAVNFRVAGQATAPTLTVNPLSAIAPGFLRKLFGAGSAPDDGARAALPGPAER